MMSALLQLSGGANADETITSANVSLTVRSDNGAIGLVTHQGLDHFTWGTPVADFGFMFDQDASTFARNSMTGGNNAGVTAVVRSGDQILANGTYTRGAYAIDFARSYQLVGADAVTIGWAVTNRGRDIGQLWLFETFDPDVGIANGLGYDTYNDVIRISGQPAAIASDDPGTPNRSVVILPVSGNAVVAAGNPFAISSAAGLVNVVNAPFDGNGALDDSGIHLVFANSLAAGATGNYRYLLVFGDTPDAAKANAQAMLTALLREAFDSSLRSSALAGSQVIAGAATAINGAHSRPLARRVATGKNTFWLAGDWGRDDHGSRSGELGLAEVGLGHNYGPIQINLSLGQTWAKQSLMFDGRTKAEGTYLVAEALVPVTEQLTATVSGYGHWGDVDIRRGYLNAGANDASSGTPGSRTWGLRARLDWEGAWSLAGASLGPYADISHVKSRLNGYTESGGGFPAQFNERREAATELRLGVNADRPISDAVRVIGLIEATHRFERNGARTSGEMIGLFGFDLEGQRLERDWLRAGIGIEGKAGDGKVSLMLNGTTKGNAPSGWLAAQYQLAF